MKELALLSSDDKSIYFIPKNRIIEAAPNEDGTTTLAVVEIINVKCHIDEILKEIGDTYRSKIRLCSLTKQT